MAETSPAMTGRALNLTRAKVTRHASRSRSSINTGMNCEESWPLSQAAILGQRGSRVHSHRSRFAGLLRGETEQEALSELDDAIIAWISATQAAGDCAGHRRVNQHLKWPASGEAVNSDPI